MVFVILDPIFTTDCIFLICNDTIFLLLQGIAPKLEFSTTSVITECLISSRKCRAQVRRVKLFNGHAVHVDARVTGLIPILAAFLLTTPISL